MKFCVIGPTYPFRGGIAHYTTLLVHHLRQHHEVFFYSYRRQYPQWLFPGNTAADPSTVPLVEPCERTIDALNPISWWQTADQVVRVKPDVLLLQWWTPFWLPLLLVVSFLARRARIPILYLCHQLIEPDSSRVEWWMARLALGFGDGVVVVSKRDYEMARRALRGRSVRLGHHPVYDGFPRCRLSRGEARQRLGFEPNERLLLFFGFVRRYKGLHYLLEALARVSDPVHLIVAGEFWESENIYRRQIEQLELQKSVTLHNRYIPNEEIEPYFVAADALVLPYLNGSQSGVSMIALYYGLPVIATRVGGLGETVVNDETGLTVPPADSAALAAAITRYFTQNLSEPFGAKIAQTRDRLSWQALIEIIEELSRDISIPAGTQRAS